jgi:hypothetical protein
VLVDGTIAECNRVGDGDHSGKARRHGVNTQAVTDPAGETEEPHPHQKPYVSAP